MTSVRTLSALALAAGLVATPVFPALAGPATDALGQCLVGETSGNDRILLVRWMTIAFASHPAVQDVVTVDTSLVDGLNRDVGQLFTELITQRCAPQTIAAVAEAGDPSVAFESAFQVLGAAASQEVMMAPEVNAAITGFVGYVDEGALTALLQP